MRTTNVKMFVVSYLMSIMMMFTTTSVPTYAAPIEVEPDTIIEMQYIEETTCPTEVPTETTIPKETIPVPTIEVQDIDPEETVLETEPDYTEPVYDAPSYTDDDLYILACIIAQEDGGGSEYSKLLIGNVVRNRVESNLFPDTYYGVATQEYQYGMMWSTGVQWPDWADDSVKEDCYAIAERILNGETVCPPNVVFQAEFEQGSGVFCKEGVHYFCYI